MKSENPICPVITDLTSEAAQGNSPISGHDAWFGKARVRALELAIEMHMRDLQPNQLGLARMIAKEFESDGVLAANGRPISATLIKRHALSGISSIKYVQGKRT
jgi:hypothetical protein